jgi:hypothetical protein
VRRLFIILTFCASFVAVLLTGPVLAQTSTATQTTKPAQTPSVNQAWTPTRLPDGQPDIQGYWNPREIGASADDVQDGSDYGDVYIMGQEMQPADVIVDPPDGKIPYLPEALAIKERRFANRHNPVHTMRDPTSSRCLLPGVPRQQYLSNFQIVQTKGHVLFLFERQHTFRVVPLDGRAHLGKDIPLWMGDSRGRWEGNTLVIDVSNNSAMTWFDRAGNYHSDALHVVERWTPVSRDRINYEATMTDPKAYSRPWTIAFYFARNNNKGFELLEEACYEGIKMDSDKYTPGYGHAEAVTNPGDAPR